MQKLTRSDIKSNEEYMKERDQRRKTIIAMKKERRIEVGDKLSFAFENRDTVRYQIQEMMRVERIEEEDKIEFEIKIYNELIPENGALSATLFIEIPEMLQVKPILDTLQGLDRVGTVFMMVGGEKVLAEFEPGHSKEDRISAVHYVRFRFNDNQTKNFADANVEIRVEHPSYGASTVLSDAQKKELAKDFSQ
jgi:Protein of unknown function (DUF3501)